MPISSNSWRLAFVPISLFAASCSNKFVIENPQQSRAGDGLYVQRIELAEQYASTFDKNLILVCYNLVADDKLQAQSCQNNMGFTLFSSKYQNGKWLTERNNPLINNNKIAQLRQFSSSAIFTKFALQTKYKITTQTQAEKLYTNIFATDKLLATITSLPPQ